MCLAVFLTDFMTPKLQACRYFPYLILHASYVTLKKEIKYAEKKRGKWPHHKTKIFIIIIKRTLLIEIINPG